MAKFAGGLAALVPRPRANLVRYHGISAGGVISFVPD